MSKKKNTSPATSAVSNEEANSQVVEMTEAKSKTEETSSLLLRLPPSVNAALRTTAKKEERTITTVAVRALRMYFKNEHGIDLD